MKRVVRWALGLVGAGLAIALALLVTILVRFNTPPAPLAGEAPVAGADGPIQIVRDAHGVPHIFASTEADRYRGLGFAHAQDRFFQMDATRRYMQGRLAELIGDPGLQSDAQARTMGWAEVARAHMERLSPEARAILQAYTEGVNAELAIGPTPPEYALFFASPEAWRIEDSLAVSLAITDQLTGGQEIERARVRLAQRLSPEQIAQFLVGYPDWAPRSYASRDLRNAGAAGLENERPGSNAWVVSGARSGTGQALLANDPHLPLRAPGPFYLARLQGPDGAVIGATLPGAPSIVIGRTNAVAWGLTTHQIDAADEIPLSDETAVTETQETIRVRFLFFFHRDVAITVRRTPDGPVLDPRWFDDMEGSPPTVLRTIADDADNGVAEALYRATHAHTVEEYFAAIAAWKAPLQNVVVADVVGNIGLISPGRFPARDEAGQWQGEIPFRIMSQNPNAGFFATANNLQTPPDFAYPMPGGHDAYRVARIAEALAGDPAHNAEHAAALQLDRTSLLARRLRDAIASGAPQTDAGRAMQARLAAWDGVADPNAVEPTMFAYWTRAIGEALYRDELGADLFEHYQGPRDAFIDAVLTGRLPATWCDNIETTNATESCTDAVGAALDAAAVGLREQRGEDESEWVWGKVHAAQFRHPVLSALPLVGGGFTVEAPVGGNSSSVNVARNFHRNEGYNTAHAAGLRMIVDFADLNASRFVMAPGQSGHPRSPHYGDLAPMWARGEYFQIRGDWTPETAPEGAQTWNLIPAR